MKNIEAVLTAIMLENAQKSMEADAVEKTKERAYQRILEYLKIEGYLTDPDTNFKAILSPSLFSASVAGMPEYDVAHLVRGLATHRIRMLRVRNSVCVCYLLSLY